MESITTVKYEAEVYTSRWIDGSGWAWKDELITSEELTELDAIDTVHTLKTGSGAWTQWADVMAEATAEYEATDWDEATTDDQWTIVIYRIAENEDGEAEREELCRKSMWASDWATM